jgi:hypothetical protein
MADIQNTSSPRANCSSRDSFQAMRRLPETGMLPIIFTASITPFRYQGARPSPGQSSLKGRMAPVESG